MFNRIPIGLYQHKILFAMDLEEYETIVKITVSLL